MCTTRKREHEKMGKGEITEEIELIHIYQHPASVSGPQCQARCMVIVMRTVINNFFITNLYICKKIEMYMLFWTLIARSYESKSNHDD